MPRAQNLNSYRQQKPVTAISFSKNMKRSMSSAFCGWFPEGKSEAQSASIGKPKNAQKAPSALMRNRLTWQQNINSPFCAVNETGFCPPKEKQMAKAIMQLSGP
jgi:hypothetical protein